MHWVLQEDIYKEEGFGVLLQALERLDIPHSLHKVVPFSSTLQPEANFGKDTPVIVMGTVAMVRIALERGWQPGAYFNRDFTFEVYLTSPWQPHLLNGDGQVCTFARVPEQAGPFFIRPVHDTKIFTGFVMEWAEFTAWQKEVFSDDRSFLNGGTPVLVAAPQPIHSEYRIYLVGGEAVTGSLYKRGGQLTTDAKVEPDIFRFAEQRAADWSPAPAFVMDVARTPDGLRIVEAGCLNAAGYYKSDMGRVVLALEELEA